MRPEEMKYQHVLQLRLFHKLEVGLKSMLRKRSVEYQTGKKMTVDCIRIRIVPPEEAPGHVLEPLSSRLEVSNRRHGCCQRPRPPSPMPELRKPFPIFYIQLTMSRVQILRLHKGGQDRDRDRGLLTSVVAAIAVPHPPLFPREELGS
jgi:hypothetical protein